MTERLRHAPATALVFGLSEAASATAHRLHGAGWRVALAADAPPKVHCRRMAFADVWWDGEARLSGQTCRAADPARLGRGDWTGAAIPVLRLAPEAALDLTGWTLAVDARLAKRGAPLRLRGRAALAIGCGPGHVARETCDLAVETQWGARLGAVIAAGPTAALAGEPRAIEGVGRERIVYAPVGGVLESLRDIGDPVAGGEIVARLGGHPVAAPIAGTLRGMLRGGMTVAPGDKLLEVDPRPPARAVFSGIGQRPAAIADGILSALDSCGMRGPDTRSVTPPDSPTPREPSKGDIPMKLSARNVLKGKVAGIEPGAVTTIVRIDLGGGVIVTSSITKAAADDLALSVGDEAFAVIKASDVLVGKP